MIHQGNTTSLPFKHASPPRFCFQTRPSRHELLLRNITFHWLWLSSSLSM